MTSINRVKPAWAEGRPRSGSGPEVEADAEIAEKPGVRMGYCTCAGSGWPTGGLSSWTTHTCRSGASPLSETATTPPSRSAGCSSRRPSGGSSARRWIGAAADFAALLELEPGVPVLRLDRVAYVLGDLSIESVTAFCHPDCYQHYGEPSLRPDGEE